MASDPVPASPEVPPAPPAVVPARRLRHAVVPLALGLAAGVGAAFGGVHYGASLFLLTPLAIGMGAAWIPGDGDASSWACIRAGWLVHLVLGGLFLLLGLEGLLCLVMAAPLLLVLSLIGAMIGHGCRRWSGPRPYAAWLVCALVPCCLAWEAPPVQPATPVTTEIVVHATPEEVWRQTVDFTPITAPPTGLLRLGIAYPTHAVLRLEDGRRVRECHFTTGPFIEPVTAWEPPTHLAFEVAAQPPPMRELGPWDIHPPHLDGMIRSRHGEFRIEALGDGTTRLRGTTWYTIEAAPAPYWSWWTTPIIHAVHRRVLEHIAAEAERAAARRP